MRGKQLALLVLVSLLTAVSPASALIVNFDEIDASAGDVSLDGSTYSGLSWTNFLAYTTVPGFDGFNAGIVSPANASYSGGQYFDSQVRPVLGFIAAPKGTEFDFTGATFGSGYYDGLTLSVTAKHTNASISTSSITLDTKGPKHFDFDFLNLESLTFTAAAGSSYLDPFACGTFNCTQFTMDDASIAVRSVPEPATAGMLLLGLALVEAVRRRRT